MQRSSESIACLATALAKAQAELTNPEKSLVATIRPNGPGIMRDSGARTLALRSDDGEGPRSPSWKFAPHCSPPVTILGRRLSSTRLWPRLPPSVTRYAFLGCRLRSRTPGPPPFSSMNSTPARFSTLAIAASVAMSPAYLPVSMLVIVLRWRRVASARSRTVQFSAARAILTCALVTGMLLCHCHMC